MKLFGKGKFKMTHLSSEERLREFVDLVRELRSSSLSQRLLSKNSVTSTHYADGRTPVIQNFDEDSCRAFLLSFRLLIRDNDRISLRSARSIVDAGDFPEDRKRLIEGECFRLSLSLTDHCPLATDEGNPVTNQYVFDTFLWGFYAHRGMDPVVRRRYLKWEQNSSQFVSLKTVFLLILKLQLETAIKVADVVTELLGEYPKSPQLCIPDKAKLQDAEQARDGDAEPAV